MVFVPVSSMLSSLNQRRDSWDAILKTQNNSNEAGNQYYHLTQSKYYFIQYNKVRGTFEGAQGA